MSKLSWLKTVAPVSLRTTSQEICMPRMESRRALSDTDRVTGIGAGSVKARGGAAKLKVGGDGATELAGADTLAARKKSISGSHPATIPFTVS